ncbi:sigma-54-dependent Fis family transcriptional regulator [Bacillus aquiflavi]|uniref:sigma-54-dependent Fis family transcriptional regulator n=1 Tax=Bacillus aquiflavi TaxID=2672567 RepID=UPI001CA8F212|nr:sigma-54-dependent Fis family transcriptional regulator [Bacillus aquiflavi]UAC47779.1 sigma-54-dependent Fis family transcriptional regulator [Bacillus aquiflavi]
MKNREKVKNIWWKFVKTGQLDKGLHPIVEKSWLRSKKLQVDPFQKQGKLRKMDFVKMYDELIEISIPLMEGLFSLVKGSGFLVILCNEKGQLLKSIGDQDMLENAQKINFSEGADWSEEAMGTNAIGTAIVIDKPLQIFAEEHYTKVCQSWTCSAAPIHQSNGEIIGVLNMSGPYERVHPHTLGMVVSTVKAIEYQLRLKENMKKNMMMQRILEATTNNMTDGILIVHPNGEIIKTNTKLQHLLSTKPEHIEGRFIQHFFVNHIFQKSLQKQIYNKELRLEESKTGKIHHVLIDIIPIDKDKKIIGSMIVIKEIQRVRQFVNYLSGNQAKVSFDEIIGSHPLFIQKLKEAKMAAKTNSNVLILGESGTGKDMFAQAIHNESNRKNKPFIAINCGGIPRDLLGSELFGYVEGAFTGAKKGGSAGKFELADGGTLFLDEIGEMSLEMQVLLLRVIQEKEVIRIGDYKVTPVDVRIIAATNKDLRKEVEKGSFREDLFFRLNVMPITLPALRERQSDIPLLAQYFISELSSKLNKEVLDITSEFLNPLMEYRWPGNIRELQNILERILNKKEDHLLMPEDLPEEIFSTKQFKKDTGWPLNKDDMKKQALMQSIRLYNGNFRKAAKHLGISRSTLYRQLKKYNIPY